MSKLDYSFSYDYMVLRPDKAGVFDLLHLLCSSQVWKNRAVDCFTGTEIDEISRRWALFISLLLQMVLLWMKKPMAILGAAIELVVNFFMIILQGKIRIPDQTSSTYRSITNLIGTRIKFDKMIEPSHDSGYLAQLSIIAARLAYENESFIHNIITHHWQMEFLGFYNYWNEFQNDYSAQAFIFCDKLVDAEFVVVAFRGTKLFDAVQWRTNIDLSWYKVPQLGKVHAGFMNALGLKRNIGWPKRIEQEKKAKPLAYYSIRDMLRNVLETNKRARFLVTGHGTGGALAILFPTILAYHKECSLLDRLEGVYTFAQPRVGDETLGLFMERQLDSHKRRYFRIMPREPSDDSSLLVDHFGLCPCFASFNKLKVLKEEMNNVYFSMWIMMRTHVIPACWLVLSFLLAYWRSLHYKKLLLGFMSIVALLLPELTFQTIQDYVNCILQTS